MPVVEPEREAEADPVEIGLSAIARPRRALASPAPHSSITRAANVFARAANASSRAVNAFSRAAGTLIRAAKALTRASAHFTGSDTRRRISFGDIGTIAMRPSLSSSALFACEKSGVSASAPPPVRGSAP